MNDHRGAVATVSVAVLGCLGMVLLWPSPLASLLAGVGIFLAGAFLIDVAVDWRAATSVSSELADPGPSQATDADYGAA
jgi:hypothetical protein